MKCGDHYFTTCPYHGGIVEVKLLCRVAARSDCWFVEKVNARGQFVIAEKDLLPARPEPVAAVARSEPQAQARGSSQLPLFAEAHA